MQSVCFAHAVWYALVCNMDVCMYFGIRCGVFKMNVCKNHLIYFGVQNICSYAPHLFTVLSWARQYNCPNIVKCSNCQLCNWKWAIMLTLLYTIAQKHYPWIYTLSCSLSIPSLLLHISPCYCPHVGWHMVCSNRWSLRTYSSYQLHALPEIKGHFYAVTGICMHQKEDTMLLGGQETFRVH